LFFNYPWSDGITHVFNTDSFVSGSSTKKRRTCKIRTRVRIQ